MCQGRVYPPYIEDKLIAPSTKGVLTKGRYTSTIGFMILPYYMDFM